MHQDLEDLLNHRPWDPNLKESNSAGPGRGWRILILTVLSSDAAAAVSRLTLRTIGLERILGQTVVDVHTHTRTVTRVCFYNDPQGQPPQDLQPWLLLWEEGLGHGEVFQLHLYSSRPRGQGSAGSAAFDQDSGHDLKVEGPKGLYTVMIKFQSFIVFSSAGNT